jgi:hypothetical protein
VTRKQDLEQRHDQSLMRHIASQLSRRLGMMDHGDEMQLRSEAPKKVKLPPPCQICGEIEREIAPGLYRIQHNFAIHFPNDKWAQRAPVERGGGGWAMTDSVLPPE